MVTSLLVIKNWFKTGLKPTQTQFWATWDSFWHKGESIPQASILNLEQTLQDIVNLIGGEGSDFSNKLDRGGYTATAQDIFNLIVTSISVTGDSNKIITITRVDGTVLQATFADNAEAGGPDDVINTLNFSTITGVLTAITSEGATISVSLDGRYSPIAHVHTTDEVEPTVARKYVTAVEKATALDNNDRIVISDFADSLKVKYRKWSDILITLRSMFQVKDTQIQITANTTLSEVHNGKTLIIDAAEVTLTVPATLSDSFGVLFIVKLGNTLTWATTAPHVFINDAPAPMVGTKTSFTGLMQKELATNNIYLAF